MIDISIVQRLPLTIATGFAQLAHREIFPISVPSSMRDTVILGCKYVFSSPPYFQFVTT
jgi:hypothetical protein